MANHERQTSALDGTSGWHVSAGTAQGAAHRAAGLPNQDSMDRCLASGCPGIAVAVADGHGHRRHFRSARGSEFAVAAGCKVGSRLACDLTGQASRLSAEAAVRSAVTALVREWRSAVAEHLAAEPYTAKEQAVLHSTADGREVPYGSTLLVAAVSPRWLACAQIGDGDVLLIRPDGQSVVPLPGDDRLDGLHTTSLCQADAEEAFRVGIQDLEEDPLLALLLATDGFGNSQVADPWQPSVGQDLAELAAEHDHRWFDRQIPQWAQRCASTEGSGDDTTIVLMLKRRAIALAAYRGLPRSAPKNCR
jgi:serine/threonine protein phosphatase PrpC